MQGNNEAGREKSLNHDEIIELFPLYLAGDLDQERCNLITKHLENCQQCREEIEALKNKPPELENNFHDELSERDAKKILHKSRLKVIVSSGVMSFLIGVGVLLFLFLLMFVTKPLLYSRGEEIRNVVNLGVAITQPGVFAYTGGDIGNWGNLKIEGKLQRHIGGAKRWDVGETTGTVNLWGPRPFNYNWITDRETHYEFELPQSDLPPMSEKNIRLIWESLERLPSGTVAEMAFSLDNYYDLKQVPELPGKNLIISWYALDTGERKKMEEDPYFTPFPFGINPQEYWKYAPEQPQKPQNTRDWLRGFVSGTVAQPPFPECYLEKVEWLSKRPKLFYAVAPHVQSEIPIQQRYQYLKEHGLKTYGLVLHGPVNELMALRNMSQLRRPQLGPVEWWLPDDTVYAQ